MKIKMNRLLSLLLAVFAAVALCAPAGAVSVPRLDRPCSVTVTVAYGSAPVAGGDLSIYRVCAAVENDGDHSLAPVGMFLGCGESFETLEDASALAARLAAFVEKGSLVGLETRRIGADGTAAFTGLQSGLYLFIQNEGAEGYSPIEPFIVTLPYLQDGEYVYDLAAVPKTELTPTPEPPPTPPQPDIPVTGQLWWPVPLLVCGGLVLVVLGVVLNRRKRPDEN